MCEKIHILLNIAPIFTNKVTFSGEGICPPDKSPFGTLKLIYISCLGPFMANWVFGHFAPKCPLEVSVWSHLTIKYEEGEG